VARAGSVGTGRVLVFGVAMRGTYPDR
jgi:hypothetical protein